MKFLKVLTILLKGVLKNHLICFLLKYQKKKDVDEFYNILEGNLYNKYETLPTHNLEELKYLVSKLDEINLFLTYKNDSDELASGILTVNLNKNTVLAFYISSNSKYLDHSPVRQVFTKQLNIQKKKILNLLILGYLQKILVKLLIKVY